MSPKTYFALPFPRQHNTALNRLEKMRSEARELREIAQRGGCRRILRTAVKLEREAMAIELCLLKRGEVYHV